MNPVFENVADHYNYYPYPSYEYYMKKMKQGAKFVTVKGNYLKSNKILSIGCGTIEVPIIANTMRNAEVLGIDFSQTSIDISQRNCDELGLINVEFLCVDFLKFRSNQKFDFINACGVLHHIKNVDEFMENVKRHISENGKFDGMVYNHKGREFIPEIVSTLRKEKFWQNKLTELLYTDKTVANWINSHEQNIIEYADTWITPYAHQYTAEELKSLLTRYFKNVMVDDSFKYKLLFSAS